MVRVVAWTFQRFQKDQRKNTSAMVLWTMVGEGTAATIAMLFDVLDQKLVPFPSLPATYLIHTVPHFGESHSILSSLWPRLFRVLLKWDPISGIRMMSNPNNVHSPISHHRPIIGPLYSPRFSYSKF